MVEGINLIPDGIKREWRIKKWKGIFIVASFIYAAIFSGVYLYQIFLFSGKNAELERLGGERASLLERNKDYTEIINRMNAIQQRQSELDRKLKMLSSLAAERISWSTVLKTISQKTPYKVWLRGFSTSDASPGEALGAVKKMKFIGSAPSNIAIADFMFMLENALPLVDVGLSYSQKREYKDISLYDFEITAKLKKTAEITYE